jgi:hypothetical protein
MSWASEFGGDICDDWQHDIYDKCIEERIKFVFMP